jgi:D-sedoheptulose 7-phosphate isomerase
MPSPIPASLSRAKKSVDSYKARLLSAIEDFDFHEVSSLVEILLAARERGATVFIAGNGGSASTASHYVVDWMLGTEISDPPLPVVALTDNVPGLTATGNDVEFSEIFSRQLRSLGKPGDVLIVVSASGNSPNLLAALHEAQSRTISVVAITGFDGGKLKDLADVSVHVSTQLGDYGVAEDIHLTIGHVVKEALMAAVHHG